MTGCQSNLVPRVSLFPPLVQGGGKKRDPGNEFGCQRSVIRYMAEQRIECVIFYVDPKYVGSLKFLGKERVRFPITNEHSSLVVFSKKIAQFAGLKAEAEKRGLGSSIELKFCRLENGRDGSTAFFGPLLHEVGYD